MTKKASVKLYKKLERRLTEKGFLKRIKLSKKAMLALLIQNNWKEKARNLETQRADCREILAQAEDTMRQISPVPEGGWLSYIYKETIAEMFPDNFLRDERSGMFSAGKLFYLETLRTIFADQEEKNGFSPLLSMQFLAPEEI